MLVGRENMGDVRNRLHLVAHQGIRADFLVGCGEAQAAEHYGAHLQRRLAEVGDLHVHFESAHPAGLVLAHDELQVITVGSKHEAGVVLHVLAANLLGAVDGQFYPIP